MPTIKQKQLVSFQTREDIASLLKSFDEICCEKFITTTASITSNSNNSESR